MSEKGDLNIYSDEFRAEKFVGKRENQYSKYCDLIYYESSVTSGLHIAMLVFKPMRPGHIIVTTHGWHMSMPKYQPLEDSPKDENVWVYVDMRGRAFSEGKQDCNGYELHDVIDAVEYVKTHYAEYVVDTDTVYYYGGSGGGGNGYEILNKFPDYFAAATVMCGISDYARWYQDDYAVGEFRDEMDVWIGCAPEKNPMAYQSRSGLHGIGNLHTPLFIAHGNTDRRVQICQARLYVAEAARIGKGNLVSYYEMDGVGTHQHFGNATPEQMDEMYRRDAEHRMSHRTPVALPERGSLTVHGYLVTKRFLVWLDDINKVAEVTYDLSAGIFELHCAVPVTYKIVVK